MKNQNFSSQNRFQTTFDLVLSIPACTRATYSEAIGEFSSRASEMPKTSAATPIFASMIILIASLCNRQKHISAENNGYMCIEYIKRKTSASGKTLQV